jgi:RNA polymerase sigma-70 factor (ECF subfamily)
MRDLAPVNVAAPSSIPACSLDTASVFRDHGAFVWRVLRRLGVDESDVADVCQEVFVVIHRRLEEFEGRSEIRTWVYGICVRTTSDYRKRARRRREVVTDAPPEQVSDDGPDQKLEQRQARALLDRILDGLDQDKRAVFVLYEIEQLPMSEVVSAVGCPLQTGYSRLHAARTLVTEGIRRFREERGERP